MAIEWQHDAELDVESADKIVYGIKFPWDKPTDLIRMLGVQAATSTTNTRTVTSVNTKKGVLHASGSKSETFVVDSYWLMGSPLQEMLKRAVDEDVEVGIWRIDLNQVKSSGGKRYFRADFAEATPNGVPETEAVNNLLHSNITYNINGSSQPGILCEDELDPQILEMSIKLFNFAHNTDFGGKEDPKPTVWEQWEQSHTVDQPASAGTQGGNAGTSAPSAGTQGGNAGTSAPSAGTQGGNAGTPAGSTATGAQGGTSAPANGGSVTPSTGANAGSGSSTPATGANSGAQGGSSAPSASGSAASSNGSSADASKPAASGSSATGSDSKPATSGTAGSGSTAGK